MRHRKRNNHLGRKTAHRAAMLSNMATSLIMHKRIFTTVPKAKELRKYVEPLITVSKEDSTPARRLVFSRLQNKYAVTELFQTISQKVGDRPGGYTRIIKTGHRLGDNAAMCFIELVDFNENMLSDDKAKKAKTRRSRRGKGTGADATAETKAEGVEKTEKSKEVKEPKKTKAKDEAKKSKKVEETQDETVVESTTEEVKDNITDIESGNTQVEAEEEASTEEKA